MVAEGTTQLLRQVRNAAGAALVEAVQALDGFLAHNLARVLQLFFHQVADGRDHFSVDQFANLEQVEGVAMRTGKEGADIFFLLCSPWSAPCRLPRRWRT